MKYWSIDFITTLALAGSSWNGLNHTYLTAPTQLWLTTPNLPYTCNLTCGVPQGSVLSPMQFEYRMQILFELNNFNKPVRHAHAIKFPIQSFHHLWAHVLKYTLYCWVFRGTFKIKKNRLLTWSISHFVPTIFWFKKNANEVPYDVIYLLH